MPGVPPLTSTPWHRPPGQVCIRCKWRSGMHAKGSGAVPRTHLHRTCGAAQVSGGLRGPNGVGASEVASGVDKAQLCQTGITSQALNGLRVRSSLDLLACKRRGVDDKPG